MTPRRLQKRARELGFPEGLWAEEGYTGLVAQTSRGVVTWLGWCEAGRPDGGTWLELESWRRQGRLVTPAGSCGSPDEERFTRGWVERIDAWSDNSGRSRMRWSAWSLRAVDVILSRARCVICGGGLSERPGVAFAPDRRRHVCQTCLDFQRDPLPRCWPLGERRCGFCELLLEGEALLFEGQGGCLCPACMANARGA